jgi:hypothetical protein
MADQREILEELNRAARSLSDASAQLDQSNRAASVTVNQAVNSLQLMGSGAIEFSRSLTNGQEGMSKYGSAIADAASGLGGLAQLAGGPFTFVLGGLIKIVGAVVGSVLKSNDTIISGYDKLADVGGAAAFSTDSLMAAAGAADFPVANGSFTKLVDTMSKMGGDLMGLGSTAGEGMKNFLKISTVGADVRHQFNRLGISQEKLTQVQAQYVSTQLKIGGLQNKNTDQLRKESLEYATELIELSAVTGQSVDQIAKNRDEDAKNLAWQLKSREILAQANGEAIMKRLNAGLELSSKYGAEQRSGIRDAMSRDALITPEAISLGNQFALAGDDLLQAIADLKADRITATDFDLRMKVAINKVADQYGRTFMLAGNDTAKQTAITSDSLTGAAKQIAKGSLDQAALDVAAGKVRADSAKQAQDALKDTSLALAEAFDKFISLISGAVNRGFEALMYAFKALTKGIFKFLTSHASLFGAEDMDQSLPYMFDSIEDLVKMQQASVAALAEVEGKKLWVLKQKGPKPNIAEGLIATARMNLIEGEEKKVKAQKAGVTLALQQLLGTKDVDKALKEKEAAAAVERKKQEIKDAAAKVSAPVAAISANVEAPAAAAAPKTISIGAGTVAPPTEKFDKGGVAKHPMMSLGASPNSGPIDISLPGGRDIPTTLEMPANLTSQRDSLLTQTESIDRILSGYTSNLTAAVGNTPTTAPASTRSFNNDMIVALSYKLDELLNKMKDNTSLQSELLALSKR